MSCIFNESLHKINQFFRVDRFLTENKMYFSSIADCADHVDMHLHCLIFQHRCFAFRCVSACIIALVLNCCFAAPEYLCSSLFCGLVNGGIGVFQPFLHLFRLLIHSLFHGSLNSKAPALEIFSYSTMDIVIP